MIFKVFITPGARDDLDYFRSREKKIILDAISEFLGVDANVETRRRKCLRANNLAPWELRVGDYRIFYEISDDTRVRVLAIGHKEHNDLFVQGKRIEL